MAKGATTVPPSSSGTTSTAPPAGAAVKKPSILPAFNRRPPKMRIKLSLRTLPTLANRKAIPQPKVAESQAAMVPVQPEPKEPVDDDDDDDETDDDDTDNNHDDNDNANDNSSSDEEEDDDGDVRATVVDSDEEGADDEVVAAIVGEAAKAAHRGVKATPGGGSSGPTRTRTRASAGAGGGTPKRRVQPTRAIRMPPIASPALLMVLPPMSSTSASHGGGPDKAESSLPVPPSSSGAGPTSSSSSKRASGQHHHLHPDSKPYVTPAAVFDASMEAAGYTYERRTKEPHRGSSVKRTVGDMFDSDVTLTLRFPPLVPPELLQIRRRRSIGNHSNEPNKNNNNNENEHENNTTLPELLLSSIPRKRGRSSSNNGSDGPNTISLSFASMVPASLTIPYPEDYIQKRIKYAEEVDAREQAIVRFQEAQEDKAAEIADAAAANADAMAVVDDDATVDGTTGAAAPHSTVVPASPIPSTALLAPARGTNGKLDLSSIPPIPEPPSPPTLADLQGFPGAEHYKNDHPLYPPQSDNFVSHLDPQAYHIADGRYFGLSTNFIADPNFVGPHAPGLNGVSTGSGLATSSSGSGGISGAMALTLSTTYNGVTAGALAALRSSTNLATLNNANGTNNSSGYNPSGSSSNASSSQFSWSYKNSFRFQSEGSSSSPESSPRHHSVGAASDPRPTAAAADLKRLMEQQDDDTDEAAAATAARMRLCIIRAAVYASRSGRHTQSFLGSNGETYPDVSKAFASHAGVKPCQRCKSNKQGVRAYSFSL